MVTSARMRNEETFKMTQLSPLRHKIEIFGKLPLGWAGSLAQGLTNRKMNILSGYAKRVSMSRWTGEFIIEPDIVIERVPTINFGAIIDEWPDTSHQRITLEDFSINKCFKANGSIYVTVEGRDQLGFLAGVLKKFMSCSLFPWDFIIGTENGRISDKFHLMGPSGTNVSSETVNLLGMKLRESVI